WDVFAYSYWPIDPVFADVVPIPANPNAPPSNPAPLPAAPVINPDPPSGAVAPSVSSLALASSVSVDPPTPSVGEAVDMTYEMVNGGTESAVLTEVYVDGSGPSGFWKAWACGGPNGQPGCSALDPGQTAGYTSVLSAAASPGDWSIGHVI